MGTKLPLTIQDMDIDFSCIFICLEINHFLSLSHFTWANDFSDAQFQTRSRLSATLQALSLLISNKDSQSKANFHWRRSTEFASSSTNIGQSRIPTSSVFNYRNLLTINSHKLAKSTGTILQCTHEKYTSNYLLRLRYMEKNCTRRSPRFAYLFLAS